MVLHAVRNPQSAIISPYVDDVALRIYPHLLDVTADAAHHRGVPGFVELLHMLLGGGLDGHLLVAVFTTMLARVTARDALGPLLRDPLDLRQAQRSSSGFRSVARAVGRGC